MNDLINTATITQLLAHSGIVPMTKRETLNENSKMVINESQRCLNNLLLQSPAAQSLMAQSEALKGILEIVVKWKELELPHEMFVFDMKILFLVTALRPETR